MHVDVDWISWPFWIKERKMSREFAQWVLSVTSYSLTDTDPGPQPDRSDRVLLPRRLHSRSPRLIRQVPDEAGLCSVWKVPLNSSDAEASAASVWRVSQQRHQTLSICRCLFNKKKHNRKNTRVHFFVVDCEGNIRLLYLSLSWSYMKVKPLQTCRHQSTVRCSWLQSWISHLYQTFMRWWKEKKAHIIKCRMVSSPLHWGVCGPHDSVHCPTCSPSSAYNHCKQTNERHILNILHRLRSLNCVSNRYPEEEQQSSHPASITQEFSSG